MAKSGKFPKARNHDTDVPKDSYRGTPKSEYIQKPGGKMHGSGTMKSISKSKSYKAK